MKPNMGNVDRVVRIVAAIVIAVLYFTGQISGLATSILGVVAVAFLATGMLGSCPMYMPFGISTREKSS